jgi:hypothetical protein
MLLYTEFLQGINKPDSEGAIEAYSDILKQYAGDPSLTQLKDATDW